MDNDSPTRTTLTPCQRRWLEHLETWEASGGTLRAYATEHDLSISGLYTARRELTRRGAWKGKRPSAAKRSSGTVVPRLLPVRITSPGPATVYRVLLPNATAVEVPEHADAERARVLLGVVRALP